MLRVLDLDRLFFVDGGAEARCVRCRTFCHYFSTLNHNLGYCYNDARVIKWIFKQLRNDLRGGARSFED
ncbi:hypothetical protein SBA3_400034 [Candidatus Sulfopaludibacter sp. SbA3]|nr:hypothetical protein SBA3_400034 [Candidatus Sulfopaludibacter sp. SbA3]